MNPFEPAANPDPRPPTYCAYFSFLPRPLFQLRHDIQLEQSLSDRAYQASEETEKESDGVGVGGRGGGGGGVPSAEETTQVASQLWSLVAGKIGHVVMLKDVVEKSRTVQEFKDNLLDIDRDMLERATVGQSDNPRWFESRKFSITGTSCHTLSIAARKKIFTSRHGSMITKRDDKPLCVPAVLYGRKSEGIARWQFVARNRDRPGFAMFERGIMTHEKYPFLAASVDGIWNDMGEMKLLEIKSPYSLKDTGLADAGRLQYLVGGPPWTLKRTHQYYSQVQLYMSIYSIDVCTFLVWTPMDYLEIQVVYDKNFADNLVANLASLYMDIFIPGVLDKTY